ncbi:MAG: flagellar export chaperone FliS [Terriglobia bacterium]
MSFNSLSNVYQQVEVNTCNKLQLVVMLYDGAIRFLGEARTAILTKNVRAKAVALDRALAIIGELQSTLQLADGGDVAASLNSLYNHMNESLLLASAQMDAKPVEHVIRLLKTLNSAWTEIAQKAEHASVVAQQPNVSAPLVGIPVTEAHRPLEVFG